MQPKLLACLVTAAMAFSACGDDDDDSDASATTTTEADDAATTTTAPTTDTTEAVAAVVQTGQTDLGEVLTDAEGLTLYGFTNDTDGVPTCEAGCAETWPPLIVDSADLPAGLDPNVFSVAERPDGTFQLVAGVWPLYLFSGDAAAGDANGQGLNDVWFVVTPSGELIQG